MLKGNESIIFIIVPQGISKIIGQRKTVISRLLYEIQQFYLLCMKALLCDWQKWRLHFTPIGHFTSYVDEKTFYNGKIIITADNG